MNMTTVPSDKLKEMQQEIADLKEIIAQQADQIAGLIATNATLDAEWKKTTADKFAEMAEVIRLKDEALIAVRDDYSLNISNSVLDQMCDAIDIQPSPEILQTRDERVVEACVSVIDEVIASFGKHSLVGVTKTKICSGEWRKYL